MRVFGWISYAKIPDYMRSKVDAKSVKYIFIEYCKDIKAYRIMYLETKKIIKICDVEFFEHKNLVSNWRCIQMGVMVCLWIYF